MVFLSNVNLIAVDCIHPDKAVYALEKSMQEIKFNRVLLLTDTPVQHTDIESITINKLSSGEEVSKFILSQTPKYIDDSCEFIMFVQADGFIMNPLAWVDEFLEYDYIGAPWKPHPHHHWPPFPNITNETRVGNGGFSIRSAKLCQSVTDIFKKYEARVDAGILAPAYHPEDCFICRTLGSLLRSKGFTFAPVELAEKFSCENKVYSGQFGFHGKETISINKWNL